MEKGSQILDGMNNLSSDCHISILTPDITASLNPYKYVMRKVMDIPNSDETELCAPNLIMIDSDPVNMVTLLHSLPR